MNWDALSAAAEWGGTLAVVVSLLYVAMQVRQNSNFSRAATQQTLVNQSLAISRWVSEDPARIAVLRKVANGFDDLTPDEQYVAYAILSSWLAGLENALYFKEAGICHDAVYEMQERITLIILGTRGGREFWRHGRHLMGADLGRKIDELLARDPATLPPLAAVMPWLAEARRDTAA
ncbi:MAG: hypothetical protein GC201_02815 [Alphaproteobacteria bacterium]|nr:hypothetical protein [Alphaproteobacteria bacterium]